MNRNVDCVAVVGGLVDAIKEMSGRVSADDDGSARRTHDGDSGPRTVRESNAKRSDEHVQLEDLRRATKVVARTLLELLA